MATSYLFLRGINVAGIRVGMPELRETLTAIGAQDVRTWLATGNVRLEWEGSSAQLEQAAEQALRERFDYEAYVLVRSDEQLRELVAAYPYPVDDTAHRYVVFGGAHAWPDVEPLLTGDSEQAQVAGDELCWLCPKGSSTTSAVAKLLAKKAYKASTTTRNLNTLEKMLA